MQLFEFCSSRLSESPSNNSADATLGGAGSHPTGSEWDSDMEVEADPPDWQTSVPPDDLASLHPHEKKRQDIINGKLHFWISFIKHDGFAWNYSTELIK